MKQKILFIIMVLLTAVSAPANPQRSYIAGKFKVGLDLEGEQRKEIRNNEHLVFLDSQLVDLNMDGRLDVVHRNDGLHVEFQHHISK